MACNLIAVRADPLFPYRTLSVRQFIEVLTGWGREQWYGQTKLLPRFQVDMLMLLVPTPYLKVPATMFVRRKKR